MVFDAPKWYHSLQNNDAKYDDATWVYDVEPHDLPQNDDENNDAKYENVLA